MKKALGLLEEKFGLYLFFCLLIAPLIYFFIEGLGDHSYSLYWDRDLFRVKHPQNVDLQYGPEISEGGRPLGGAYYILLRFLTYLFGTNAQSLYYCLMGMFGLSIIIHYFALKRFCHNRLAIFTTIFMFSSLPILIGFQVPWNPTYGFLFAELSFLSFAYLRGKKTAILLGVFLGLSGQFHLSYHFLGLFYSLLLIKKGQRDFIAPLYLGVLLSFSPLLLTLPLESLPPTYFDFEFEVESFVKRVSLSAIYLLSFLGALPVTGLEYFVWIDYNSPLTIAAAFYSIILLTLIIFLSLSHNHKLKDSLKGGYSFALLSVYGAILFFEVFSTYDVPQLRRLFFIIIPFSLVIVELWDGVDSKNRKWLNYFIIILVCFKSLEGVIQLSAKPTLLSYRLKKEIMHSLLIKKGFNIETITQRVGWLSDYKYFDDYRLEKFGNSSALLLHSNALNHADAIANGPCFLATASVNENHIKIENHSWSLFIRGKGYSIYRSDEHFLNCPAGLFRNSYIRNKLDYIIMEDPNVMTQPLYEHPLVDELKVFGKMREFEGESYLEVHTSTLHFDQYDLDEITESFSFAIKPASELTFSKTLELSGQAAWNHSPLKNTAQAMDFLFPPFRFPAKKKLD